MKRLVLVALAILCFSFISNAIAPYLNFGGFAFDNSQAAIKVKEALGQNGYNILGEYNVAGKASHHIIAFTSDELIALTSKANDKGLLAAVMKASIVTRAGKTNLIMLNPEYINYAYLRDAMDDINLKNAITAINTKAINTFELLANSPSNMGGNFSAEDLKSYRYMFGMPRFSDTVVLKTFKSHEEALATVSKNCQQKTGHTKLIYTVQDSDSKTAIFGIGLLDKNIGEPKFMPIIGEDYAAAMPCEIIVHDKIVCILHGRYRLALHWPELSMATFSKIMSTPGDIEDQLKALTE